MMNLREFWQAAMANLRAIFSARPAPPRRPPLRALPGPVTHDEWTVQPPRRLEAAQQPETEHSQPEQPQAEQSVHDYRFEDEPSGDSDQFEEGTYEFAPEPDVPAQATPAPAAGHALDRASEDAAPFEAEPIAAEPVEPPAHAATPPAGHVAPSQPPHADQKMPMVVAILEALLFVAAEPTATADLARALELSPEETDAALTQLGAFYQQQGRGLRVQLFNGKVQLVTAPVAAPYIERFLNLDSTTRLSGPALETLAVVAYRQPVTRTQIESVRGVDCAGVLRSLLQRGLVTEVGRVDAPGRPILYGVTENFMQHFGLTGLDELPPLEEDDADRLWAATLLAEEEGSDEDRDEARDEYNPEAARVEERD